MKFKPDEAINLYGEKVRVKVRNWYNERNKIIDNYYLFYDEDEIYHIENSSKGEVVYTFRCNCWDKAIAIAHKRIEKMTSLEYQLNKEPYKILFHETDKFLYYITTDKTVVKMREKLRENMTFHRYEVPLTKEDHEMIKNNFDIDEVYQEKILDFRKIRGSRPVRKVNIAWS